MEKDKHSTCTVIEHNMGHLPSSEALNDRFHASPVSQMPAKLPLEVD